MATVDTGKQPTRQRNSRDEASIIADIERVAEAGSTSRTQLNKKLEDRNDVS